MQKALDAVRVAPIWLLVALFLSIMLIWVTPGYLALLPVAFAPLLPLASALLGIAALCRIIAEFVTRVTARWALSRSWDQERLIHLYRPLFALFLTRHVTITTGTASPHFRDRWANALNEIGAYRRRSVRLMKAWHALFDHQSSTSAEIEFGQNFPMAEILSHVRAFSKYADVKLLGFVRRAHRSGCDTFESNLLTDEELELFQYICHEHDQLSRRNFS